MRCPIRCRMTTASDGTSRRSGLNGPARRRRTTSTGARSRSTADRTRSRRTSSPRRFWDCERIDFELGLRTWTSHMDFELSDEQRLLRQSVERLLADRYDFAARKRFAQEPAGFSEALWRQYAELGL